MKKGLVFFLGMIVGALITFAIMSYINSFGGSEEGNKATSTKRYSDPGIKLLDEPGEVLAYRSFKVYQVLPNGSALMQAIKKNKPDEFDFVLADLVLFLPEGEDSFYDGLIIRMSSNQCARLIGTYRYETRDLIDQSSHTKTVPIVKIVEK